MNQRFEIYTRTSNLNSYGEQTDSFVYASSVWGRARHSVSDDSLASDKHQPVHKVEFSARSFPASSGDQIEYAGYRWEVEGVRRRHRSNNVTIIANRLHAAVRQIAYYLQPDGASFYLTPTGDKYQQP